MSNKAELIFFAAPFVGHITSTVEFAKLLVAKDQRLSVTVFVMNVESSVLNNSLYSKLIANYVSSENIKFINLPAVHADPSLDGLTLINSFLELQKVHVKQVLSSFIAQPNSPKLAGFVIDMFCTPMIDLANEFNVPTYIFYVASASHLCLTFYFLNLLDLHNIEFKNSEAEYRVPGFVNPVPAKVLPMVMTMNDSMGHTFYNHARRYKEVKGIMVNTFLDLESHVVEAMSNGECPTVYPVGPILSLSNNGGNGQFDDTMKWLDDQPRGSVVFLCFGSIGCFPDEQVREIATALEKSGYRFLWTLRKSPPKGKIAMPSDYENFSNVLPEGFLDRTAEIGKVIGWAPQAVILAHPSIGGFVSHCGWNSILESTWFGVPIATWPLFADQQMNAFLLLEELKLAVEIMMDHTLIFSNEEDMIIGADEIERRIRNLVEIDVEKVQKGKEMSEMSKKALEDGGSSYIYLGNFIDDIFNMQI